MAVVVPKPRSLRDQVSPEEWAARVDLACAYRLVAHHGWTWMIYNHISARVPGQDDQFLLNPFGLHYTEVTASNLVKIDLDGKILDGSPYPINDAGFTIHSAIHGARHDVAAVLHTHTDAGAAVSALETGLLPFSQDALLFYNRIAYHDFEGIALDLDERSRLVRDLGPHFAMILRNHGLLTCGRSVAEAFQFMFQLERVCRSQLAMMATGAQIRLPPPEVCEKTALQYRCNRGEVAGVDEWPHWVRMMDALDPSYRS
jgi:ribulose-5-phosphate 4-epimerase/fuculose-1-phosphate aldolase